MIGNALDNAIESSINLPEEKKIIQLKIFQENFFLLIRMTNYYEHDIVWSNGNLVTNKSDKENHGFGLKSITYAVEKYEGTLNIEAREGRFAITILFSR